MDQQNHLPLVRATEYNIAMKNFLITILLVVVGILSYAQFVKNDTGSSDSNTSQTSKNTEAQNTAPTSGGKTLDFSNQDLTQLNKDILDDGKVTTLNVSNNDLTGALPAEIRKLTNLQILDASNNKMTGIPAEIGQLDKLKTANFANNNLSGLPLEIGNLSNLETLDLRGNPNISEYDISIIQPKIPNAKILTD